jgi:hypothetical protein
MPANDEWPTERQFETFMTEKAETEKQVLKKASKSHHRRSINELRIKELQDTVVMLHLVLSQIWEVADEARRIVQQPRSEQLSKALRNILDLSGTANRGAR